MNHYLKWFCPIVWLGILANLGFALPAIFFPEWLLRWVNLPTTYELLWLRDAGLLLFFLSILYFPASVDPLRYKFNAVAMVIARLAFGLFWLWPFFFANAPKAYLIFGAIDLGFGIVQGILLLLLLREEEHYAQLH